MACFLHFLSHGLREATRFLPSFGKVCRTEGVMGSVVVRCGLRFAACCVAVVSLCSCATGAAVLGIAYTVQTNRLPTDALASAILQKDCNLIRQEEEGGAWCRDKGAERERRASQPPVWCYRSLGEVSCYDRPIAEESAQLVQ